MREPLVRIRLDGNGRTDCPGESLSGSYRMEGIAPPDVRAVEVSVSGTPRARGTRTWRCTISGVRRSKAATRSTPAAPADSIRRAAQQPAELSRRDREDPWARAGAGVPDAGPRGHGGTPFPAGRSAAAPLADVPGPGPEPPTTSWRRSPSLNRRRAAKRPAKSRPPATTFPPT